jgi:hypothetical protein
MNWWSGLFWGFILTSFLVQFAWRKRHKCMHHDRITGQTWVESRIIDPGKTFWCTHCRQRWFV